MKEFIINENEAGQRHAAPLADCRVGTGCSVAQ